MPETRSYAWWAGFLSLHVDYLLNDPSEHTTRRAVEALEEFQQFGNAGGPRFDGEL